MACVQASEAKSSKNVEAQEDREDNIYSIGAAEPDLGGVLFPSRGGPEWRFCRGSSVFTGHFNQRSR